MIMNVKKLAKGALCFCLAFLSTMAYAQNKEVTGKVTDSKDGSPLAGVSVVATSSKGKKSGAATSADGTFRIVAAD